MSPSPHSSPGGAMSAPSTSVPGKLRQEIKSVVASIDILWSYAQRLGAKFGLKTGPPDGPRAGDPCNSGNHLPRFLSGSDFGKLGLSLSAPIAQLDRALVYETRGPRFESWWARHLFFNNFARFSPFISLDAAQKVEDLNLLTLDTHPLKGNRKGEWAMTVTKNWRITFRFEAGNAYQVNLEDLSLERREVWLETRIDTRRIRVRCYGTRSRLEDSIRDKWRILSVGGAEPMTKFVRKDDRRAPTWRTGLESSSATDRGFGPTCKKRLIYGTPSVSTGKTTQGFRPWR